MSSTRRSLARYRQSPADREDLRKRRDAQAVMPLSEPGIVRMQHTMGNQAVQRLIQRDLHPNTDAEVQRAPGGQQDKNSRPSALATIVLGSGKLVGKGKTPGHEGKLELMSIQRGTTTSGRISITVMRYADDLSPKIQEANVKGDPVTSAQFELVRHEDDEVSVIHTMDFTDGYISSYSIGSHEGQAIETIIFEFGGDKKDERH